MSEKRFDFLPLHSIVNDAVKRKSYYLGEKEDVELIVDLLNSLYDENERLRKENQQYKSILQGMGLLLSDDDVISIRKDIANEIIKPLLKENGFDVDIDVSDGFTIIPRGENV